jgi:hypothetical protein
LEYRSGIYKRFEGLFQSRDEEEDEYEVEGRLTVADAKAIADENERSKWSWIGVIWNLSNGDITKTNEVLAKPIMEVLIWLSYQKIKNEQ